MSIDLSCESLITLAEASRLLPGRPSVSTLWRWHTKGVRGGIKLETAKLGGTRMTSREALQRFSDRLTGGTAQPLKLRTSKQREADIARAERELDALPGETDEPRKARSSKKRNRVFERDEEQLAKDGTRADRELNEDKPQ